MQPAPDQQQTPANSPELPTVPLIPPQKIAGGKGLMPVHSTIPPPPDDLPPLPTKQDQATTISESPEGEGAEDTTEIESYYTVEVDAPESAGQRLRRMSTTVRYVFIVIEIALALRFFLKLVGANPSSPFGVFLYGITDPLTAPFASLFKDPQIGSGEVEFTTLLALIVYPIFCWVIIRGIQLMFYREQGGLRTVRQKRRASNDGA